MSGMPTYFESIRQKAAQRWDQLERDPELAGPWHQLFKQVQSPRHILSELLQNADDAGATEASVHIKDNVFTFEHNGEDFTEEHFASLCRFGYSNKRALHTIGFRGIGFKSTFSLGNRVDLLTPSLSLCFHSQRFTEPQWLQSQEDTSGRTRIRVEISDPHRQREVEKNLDEWLMSPVSLLFFRSIRRMRIGEREIHWGSLGLGPIPESEWMALDENQDRPFLVIRSEAEAFPEEALVEIRQERMLGSQNETEFPPCRVEIVLGAKGRLYVVLPTGVETALPFACNAPFIQDPARLKIKDPETSPTNRWLLERAGKLAASAMLHWLGRTETSLVERARAYGLFPDVNQEDNTLEGGCSTIVVEAFADTISGQNLLLTENGQLVPERQSIIIPQPLLDVWAPEQAAALLDEQDRPPLCRHVDLAYRNKILRWGIIDEINKQKLLIILQGKRLPKPESWRRLLNLWAYIASEITGYRRSVSAKEVRIVPVQGEEVLYAATQVVRLGEKRLLQREEDWEFLAKYLIVVNQNWTRFLAEQRRTAADQNGPAPHEAIEGAYAVLKEIGLDDASDVNKVIDRVASEFFSQVNVTIQGCVQLAQIAAKLGVNGGSFHYVTRDRRLRSTDNGILFDEDGELEGVLPEAQRETQLLNRDYTASYTSCSRDEWLRWINSGKSGLKTFVSIVETTSSFRNRRAMDDELKRRMFPGVVEPTYKNPLFFMVDWDFRSSVWDYWQQAATERPQIWTIVAKRLLREKEGYWSQKTSARVIEEAANGCQRTVVRSNITPSWVLRLREVPCLPDTHGFHRKPEDLLRRTPETESLMDVEPFIHGLLDRENVHPLLDLLGVRKTPTGPDRLLDRLRALSMAERPPVHDLEKWYCRLDQMVETCSTMDLQKIRQAFRSEKLILTLDCAWATTTAVFIASDEEDVPDAAVIRPSVKDLALWRKIGVAERPTADLAIEWLKGLPSGKVPFQEDLRRVRALLARYPARIWEECGHWFNLANEWAPIDELTYSVNARNYAWVHLHLWVKQKTADLRGLPSEAISNPPFSGLLPLAAQIEERFRRDPLGTGQPMKKEWLRSLGAQLCRVEFETDEETERVRALADSLARTVWLETPGIEIIPYIAGTPAGTSRRADVVWLDQSLYAEPLPKAKLARRVPEEIGKAFARPDIKAALDYGFERSPQDVREYLEANFKLSAAVVALAEPPDGASSEHTEASLASARPEDAENIIETPTLDRTVGKNSTEIEPEITRQEPADDSDDEQTVVDGVCPPEHRSRPAPKPAKPSLIERFAKAQEFRKDGDERFYHDDGSWIGRANGARFPWERRTSTGDLVRYYWPKDHCLESDPLQIEADIWWLIEQHPETHSLILSSIDGCPVEVSGTRLCAMRDRGEVNLYPATYRLVYDHDRHA